MKLLPVVIVAALLLPSCSWAKKQFKRGEYSPEYLREDSALDAPGVSAARAEQRNRLVKEGAFGVGESVEVQQGRVFLLDRNPDTTTDPSGSMVSASTAKILSCEGLYYFVELDNGKRGFLRESDLVTPLPQQQPAAQLVPTGEAPVMSGTEADVFGMGETPGPVQLEGNQTLTTNEDGRSVILVGKKTDRTDEFEARKKAMESGAAAPAKSSSVDDPPPLPASSLDN